MLGIEVPDERNADPDEECDESKDSKDPRDGRCRLALIALEEVFASPIALSTLCAHVASVPFAFITFAELFFFLGEDTRTVVETANKND